MVYHSVYCILTLILAEQFRMHFRQSTAGLTVRPRNRDERHTCMSQSCERAMLTKELSYLHLTYQHTQKAH